MIFDAHWRLSLIASFDNGLSEGADVQAIGAKDGSVCLKVDLDNESEPSVCSELFIFFVSSFSSI